MTVPDYQSFMSPLLEYAGDGAVHSLREAYEALAHYFELTPEDLEELLPSGQQTIFTNRLNWANTYLKKAGLLHAPKRGHLQITEQGVEVLQSDPERINSKFLEQFDSFRVFKDTNRVPTSSEVGVETTDETKSPRENFNSIYRTLRDGLTAELLESVKTVSPTRFERIVIDLLLKMGYGGSRADAGRAIGRTNDEGIDGIINEDKLGLDIVYIQAKRWQGTVGRPEIQKFAGALQGKRARKGIFITTSDFSAQAHDFVSNIDNKIILIDGTTLVDLMFEYNVGVATEEVFEVKRIDSDYFE